MSLGLKRGTVLAIDIQHIGSTAIPAIKAKPIIDIDVECVFIEKTIVYRIFGNNMVKLNKYNKFY